MEENVFEPVIGSFAFQSPGVDYRHLLALTDDTGILQHAKYSVPDRNHGYCVDDNARALIVACQGSGGDGGEELARRVPVYLSFLHHAWNVDNRRFRNFMSYDRRWLEEAGSEDSHGRSLWGLGVAAAAAPGAAQRILAAELFTEGLPVTEAFTSPRARAFTILGIDRYLDAGRDADTAHSLLHSHAAWLHDRFTCNRSEGWIWCENYLTYANAVLPLALLKAGRLLEHDEVVATGLAALRWLLEMQIAPEGHLSIIGNDGWVTREGHRARFDQQPLDAAGLLLACAEAHRCTGDDAWIGEAHRAFGWFTGYNDLAISLYDPETGGCRDGLHAGGVNLNQGAESTIVWLLARQCMESYL